MLNSDLWVGSISSSSYWDLVYPSVTVHSSASATITVDGKTFTSDASGNTQHSMPWGTFSISDSVSGQSFACTIGRDTTNVYVMPEGALYWYGNMCTWITGIWRAYFLESGYSPKYTKNTNNMVVSIYGYTNDNNGTAIIGTSNKIDLDVYEKICVQYKLTGDSVNTSGTGIILKTTKPSNYTTREFTLSIGEYTSKYDITNYTDSLFVGFQDWSKSGTMELTIYKVWLEK